MFIRVNCPRRRCFPVQWHIGITNFLHPLLERQPAIIRTSLFKVCHACHIYIFPLTYRDPYVADLTDQAAIRLEIPFFGKILTAHDAASIQASAADITGIVLFIPQRIFVFVEIRDIGTQFFFQVPEFGLPLIADIKRADSRDGFRFHIIAALVGADTVLRSLDKTPDRLSLLLRLPVPLGDSLWKDMVITGIRTCWLAAICADSSFLIMCFYHKTIFS